MVLTVVQLKRDFTVEEIVKVVLSLGSEDYRNTPNGDVIFQTVCHNLTGGSYKLYYYPESGQFHCYTSCGDSFDVYELVKRSKDYSFLEARGYVNKLLGIAFTSMPSGFSHTEKEDDAWAMYERYVKRKKILKEADFKVYPKTLLDFHKHTHPVEWLDEGITPSAMDKYHIRYDLTNNRIIIPHFDISGNLIGIRGRALNKHDIERNGKYKPIVIEGEVLKHALGCNLYGLHQNTQAIQTIRKIIIFEAEKSVLICDGFYGEDNFAVACCGSSITDFQRDMILRLGVQDVFIAFDKERLDSIGAPKAGATRDEKAAHIREIERRNEHNNRYLDKLYNLAYKFNTRANTYLVCDDDEGGLLDYRDAPCDKGKDVFDQLMRNILAIKTKGENDEYAKQWKKL